jgi:hypothetical protein
MSDTPYVENVVLEVIQNILGKKRMPGITLSQDLTKDMKICSDDLSMYFVPELERRLNVKVPAQEWSNVYTGQDAWALLSKYIERNINPHME